MDPEELERLICCSQEEALARGLFRRNAFEASCLTPLRVLCRSGMWPAILSRRSQGHIFELPTLELCAAIVTRILCVADRLKAAGELQLVFLGIGSGDALVEASVALHLGDVLGQPANLRANPLTFDYGGFQIFFFATDTDDVAVRRDSNTAEVFGQMAITPYTAGEAVRDFCQQGWVYVLCSWPPDGAEWRGQIEELASGGLAELCFLRPAVRAIPLPETERKSDKMRLTMFYPRTLSRMDFVSRDFRGGPGAGLHHSELYVFTPRSVPPPYLAPQLQHSLGAYEARMAEDPALEAVNIFHRCGLGYACCPDDLIRPIPTNVLEGLKERLYTLLDGKELEQLRDALRRAMVFAEDRCHNQLGLLLKNSAQRAERGPNAKGMAEAYAKARKEDPKAASAMLSKAQLGSHPLASLVGQLSKGNGDPAQAVQAWRPAPGPRA